MKLNKKGNFRILGLISFLSGEKAFKKVIDDQRWARRRKLIDLWEKIILVWKSVKSLFLWKIDIFFSEIDMETSIFLINSTDEKIRTYESVSRSIAFLSSVWDSNRSSLELTPDFETRKSILINLTYLKIYSSVE